MPPVVRRSNTIRPWKVTLLPTSDEGCFVLVLPACVFLCPFAHAMARHHDLRSKVQQNSPFELRQDAIAPADMQCSVACIRVRLSLRLNAAAVAFSLHDWACQTTRRMRQIVAYFHTVRAPT